MVAMVVMVAMVAVAVIIEELWLPEVQASLDHQDWDAHLFTLFSL